MELDENLFNEDLNIFFEKQSIYIIHYINKINPGVTYDIIDNKDKYFIDLCWYIESISIGCPIINLSNNKLIGIYIDSINDLYNGKGILLKFPIIEFINNYNTINKNNNDKNDDKNENQIDIIVKIRKEDINKKIYFLDNTEYDDNKKQVKHFHDNWK